MLEALIDQFGDGAVLMMAGALVGVVFGITAQHSRFCLRAATVELAEGQVGPKLHVWLIAFSAAVFCVQGAISFGIVELSEARPLAATGSISGAVVGGLMFGAGMIFSRGCASRLLVLSATGNLRALLTGLVLTLVAQASLRGALSPAREWLSGLWLVPGGDARNLLTHLGVGSGLATWVAGTALATTLIVAARAGAQLSRMLAATGVGIAIGLGWWTTYAISQMSFEVIPLSSVTFTGPSTDTLMGLVNAAGMPMSFGVGLVPGVFIGAGFMAFASREARIERFGPDTPMERYMIGAVLMGFGSMLAGGCAVGAGMSGGSIFAVTAWIAVFCMWVGAMVTHRLMLRRPAEQAA